MKIELKKIRIKNFKCLEDFEIDVKDINLLFGVNGSGKSTFIKALLFLTKNINPSKFDKTVYKLSNDVDLVNFQNIVTNNDLSKSVVFSLSFRCNYLFPNEILFETNNKNKSDLEYFKIIADYFKNSSIVETTNLLNNDVNLDFINSSLKYQSIDYKKNKELFEENEDELILNVVFHNNEKNPLSNLFFIEIRIGETRVQFQGVDDYFDYIYLPNYFVIPYSQALTTIYDFNNFNKNEFKTYIDGDGFSKVNIEFPSYRKYRLILRKLFKKSGLLKSESIKKVNILNEYLTFGKFLYLVYYLFPQELKLFDFSFIGPTRAVPKVRYLLTDNQIVGIENDIYWERLYNSQILYDINFKEKENLYYTIQYNVKEENFNSEILYDLYFKTVCDYLDLMQLDKYIFVEKKDGVFSILSIDNKNQINNLSNEYSGLIQIIPILLILAGGSDFFRKIVFVEQPELHLHPKLQTKLAKVLTNYKGSAFIETHSEHLVRKMQALIAKDFRMNENNQSDYSLAPKSSNRLIDRVQVNYLYKDKQSGFTKNEIREIRENGFFENKWPDGFFSTGYDLTKELITGEEI